MFTELRLIAFSPCSPIISIAVIIMGVMILCLLAIRWIIVDRRGQIGNFNHSIYLLGGLALLSLLSIIFFLGVSILNVSC